MANHSRRLIAACVFVAIAGNSAIVGGQGASPVSLAALSRFESDSVWVRLGTGGELKGRLISAVDDELVIKIGSGPRAIAAADIETVEISKSAAKRGALIGALIGLPISIVAAGMADNPSGGWRVVGVIVGTAAYAGIGAAIGAVIRHRQVVYRRATAAPPE